MAVPCSGAERVRPSLRYAGNFVPHPPTAPRQSGSTKTSRIRNRVWVLPDYMTYPLMFHAPKGNLRLATHGGQRRPAVCRTAAAFISRDACHLDYHCLRTGFATGAAGHRGLAGRSLRTSRNTYCFWHDSFRSELFWRTFKPTTVTRRQPTRSMYSSGRGINRVLRCFQWVGFRAAPNQPGGLMELAVAFATGCESIPPRPAGATRNHHHK